MDSFDNFQYDSASSYGGMGIVDDNSSVYTSTTNNHTPIDLESLSISDSLGSNANGHDGHVHHHHTGSLSIAEDFDSVLDDLKDEGVVDLPPHACRYVFSVSHPEVQLAYILILLKLLWYTLSSLCGEVSGLLQMVLQLSR